MRLANLRSKSSEASYATATTGSGSRNFGAQNYCDREVAVRAESINKCAWGGLASWRALVMPTS